MPQRLSSSSTRRSAASASAASHPLTIHTLHHHPSLIISKIPSHNQRHLSSANPPNRESFFLFYSKLRHFLELHDISQNQLDVLFEVYSSLSLWEEDDEDEASSKEGFQDSAAIIGNREAGQQSAVSRDPHSSISKFTPLEQKVELYRVFCKILQQEWHQSTNRNFTAKDYEEGLLFPQKFLLKGVHRKALERRWRHHARLGGLKEDVLSPSVIVPSTSSFASTDPSEQDVHHQHRIAAAVHFPADSALDADIMPLPNGGTSAPTEDSTEIPLSNGLDTLSHSHSTESQSFELTDIEIEEESYQRFVHKRPRHKPTGWQKLQHNLKRIIFSLLPILSWIRPYFQSKFCNKLLHDVIAGTAVAAVLIPQSMAYALLAGLPPVIGLYTALTPLLVYVVFGTSRHLGLGPVSLVSLLNAAAISDLPSTDARISKSLLLAFQAGLFQFLLGFIRMGFMVNFLSTAVISGFTSAAGLLIIITELKFVLGIEFASDRRLHILMSHIVDNIHGILWEPVLFGSVCVLILLFFHFFYCRFRCWGRTRKFTFTAFPVHLVLLLLCVLLIYLLQLLGPGSQRKTSEQGLFVYNIRILGTIPKGIPSPGAHFFSGISPQEFFSTLKYSIPIGFISFLESISAAKFFATMHDYDVDANQELIALGLASIFGSFFKAYTSTGALSRSAVASQAGAASILYSLVVFAFLLMTLLFLTDVFYYLPYPLLAAIIMVAVLKLIDVKEFVECLRTKPRDALCMAVSFFVTLFVGVEFGILIAIAVSVILIVYSMSRPNMVPLGRVMGTQNYRNMKMAKQYKGILIIRFDAELLYLNVNHLKDNAIRMVRQNKYEVQVLILECSGINAIDTAGVTCLVDLHELMEQKFGVRTFYSQMKRPVRKVCHRGRLNRKIPVDRFFFQTHEAVLAGEKYIIEQNLRTNLKKNKDVVVVQMHIVEGREAASGDGRTTTTPRTRIFEECVVSGVEEEKANKRQDTAPSGECTICTQHPAASMKTTRGTAVVKDNDASASRDSSTNTGANAKIS
eukprot:CAMPEP_0117435486 /NCGR_PEP_ID=MMETSP0759-20121206/508_1 /TAXON_ID=63605 /ORGANISM="Percolomonas cosmopolitus, Strain WS" /LENGTH=1025 /DNA_ID=CAMNT_0005227039 /DNA_START=123 /DNA_END=3196 /DNA_ORIENTATION=+